MERKYIDIIINTNEFKKLKELKKIIDEKYRKEIVSFKRNEALYLEANEHPNYYSNFDDIKRKFVEAKANLYNKEEVIEYFTIERKLQGMLSDDFNELKSSISNKFIEETVLKI